MKNKTLVMVMALATMLNLAIGQKPYTFKV